MPEVQSPSEPDFQPLIVSAPFGNYVQPAGATPTLGTFTAQARPGRIRRVLRTVRYYRRLGAWVNRIGLRNPGLDWLVRRAERGRLDPGDKIVSIHGFDADDWRRLLDKTASLKPLAIELNMSCPNVGEVSWPASLFSHAAATGVPVVIKLPPVRYERMAEQAHEAGLRWAHACNTLPVPGGGLSGAPLKPIAMRCVADLLSGNYGEGWRVIAGGGVRSPQDVDEYLSLGASAIAVGTKAMNPTLLWSDAALRPLIDRAAEGLASRRRTTEADKLPA